MILPPPVDIGLIAAIWLVETHAQSNVANPTLPPTLAEKPSRSGITVGITTPIVELTQDKAPDIAATKGVTVALLISGENTCTIRSIPPNA